jgi:hypothetical protein
MSVRPTRRYRPPNICCLRCMYSSILTGPHSNFLPLLFRPIVAKRECQQDTSTAPAHNSFHILTESPYVGFPSVVCAFGSVRLIGISRASVCSLYSTLLTDSTVLLPEWWIQLGLFSDTCAVAGHICLAGLLSAHAVERNRTSREHLLRLPLMY